MEVLTLTRLEDGVRFESLSFRSPITDAENARAMEIYYERIATYGDFKNIAIRLHRSQLQSEKVRKSDNNTKSSI